MNSLFEIYQNILEDFENPSKSKRTQEQIISFFKRVGNRGEGRELYRTPPETIDKIVSNLLKERPNLKSRIWVDPCAADGAWEKCSKNMV